MSIPGSSTHILRFHGSVPHHGIEFLFRTAIITFSAAPIRAERAAVNIYRFVQSPGAGNIDDDDTFPFNLLNEHISGRENIDAGPVRIVCDVPEFSDQPVGIRQIYRPEGFIGQFLHSKQNDAAIRVGKGGISFPYTLRKAPQCLLASMRLFSRYCSILEKSIIDIIPVLPFSFFSTFTLIQPELLICGLCFSAI